MKLSNIVKILLAVVVISLVIVVMLPYYNKSAQMAETEKIYEVVGTRLLDSMNGAFRLVVRDHGDVRVLKGNLLSSEFPPKIPKYVVEVETNGRIDYKPFEIEEIQNK